MNANMFGNVIVPFALFLALSAWNLAEGGTSAVLQGYVVSCKMVIAVMLMVIIAFLITGQAQIIIARHMPAVLEFLNGRHGILGASGAGIVSPTLTSYPIAQELWSKGLVPTGVVIAIMLSSRLLNFQTVLFFLPFLGWQLTLISMGVSAVVLTVYITAIRIFG